mgnify:CR=1 FL=1
MFSAPSVTASGVKRNEPDRADLVYVKFQDGSGGYWGLPVGDPEAMERLPEADLDDTNVYTGHNPSTQLAAYLDGSLAEDAFRVFRLTNGIYRINSLAESRQVGFGMNTPTSTWVDADGMFILTDTGRIARCITGRVGPG